MEKVEEDLTRSKSVRERQAKDFSEQLDALRHKYEQQVRIPVRAPLSAGACIGIAHVCTNAAVENPPFARAAVAQHGLCCYQDTLEARGLTPI